MDPAELLKPINDRPIAALRMGHALMPIEWQALVSWLQDHGRRVVLIDGPLRTKPAPSGFAFGADLDLRWKLSHAEMSQLIFWCCLCVGREGSVLDIAREKAVPVVVSDAPLDAVTSRIEALWHRQDEEARELAQGNP